MTEPTAYERALASFCERCKFTLSPEAAFREGYIAGCVAAAVDFDATGAGMSTLLQTIAILQAHIDALEGRG